MSESEPTGRAFRDEQLLGATFEHVDLSGSSFERVDLSRSTFRSIDFSDVELRDIALTRTTIRGAYLVDVEIYGEVEGLRVNGIDVGPLLSAELDRQHPERRALHPIDPEGYREAWRVLGDLWAGTVERARTLAASDPELLHESVNGEWSFIETLRHLPFATSSWLSRAIQGDPSPWHPLELPWDEMTPTPGVPQDRSARPTLDEALELRLDRYGRVRDHLASLTETELASTVIGPEGVGWPPAGEEFPVKECLDTLINEEWWHRQFAERDLTTLEGRLATEAGTRHTESSESTEQS